jgi:hypothetical protein
VPDDHVTGDRGEVHHVLEHAPEGDVLTEGHRVCLLVAGGDPPVGRDRDERVGELVLADEGSHPGEQRGVEVVSQCAEGALGGRAGERSTERDDVLGPEHHRDPSGSDARRLGDRRRQRRARRLLERGEAPAPSALDDRCPEAPCVWGPVRGDAGQHDGERDAAEAPECSECIAWVARAVPAAEAGGAACPEGGCGGHHEERATDPGECKERAATLANRHATNRHAADGPVVAHPFEQDDGTDDS